MERTISVVLFLVLLAGCTQATQQPAVEAGDQGKVGISQTIEKEVEEMGKTIAVFETSKGNFEIELFTKKAPVTTKNFIDLVNRGFYDDLIFHRVIGGFMIQGGCPEGTGSGGPGYTIQDEFHPDLKHDSGGILSMANAGPNTGGSQFFITLAPAPWLDGKHAVFGKVISGMDVVKEIGKVQAGAGAKPVEDVVIKKITTR